MIGGRSCGARRRHYRSSITSTRRKKQKQKQKQKLKLKLPGRGYDVRVTLTFKIVWFNSRFMHSLGQSRCCSTHVVRGEYMYTRPLSL